MHFAGQGHVISIGFMLGSSVVPAAVFSESSVFISSEALFRVIRIPACCRCVSICRGSFSPKENKRGNQISCFTLVWSQLPPRMNRLEKFSVFYRNSKTQNFICRAVHVFMHMCTL